MEKESSSKTKANESLTLYSRQDLKLEGVVEVLSSSDSEINVKLCDTTLQILGTNINITKLDVTSGNLDATGEFSKINYGKSTNIFKRLFK